MIKSVRVTILELIQGRSNCGGHSQLKSEWKERTGHTKFKGERNRNYLKQVWEIHYKAKWPVFYMLIISSPIG